VRIAVKQIGDNALFDAIVTSLMTDSELQIVGLPSTSVLDTNACDVWVGITAQSCEQTLDYLGVSGILDKLPVILIDTAYDINNREAYLAANIAEYVDHTSLDIKVLKLIIGIAARIHRSGRSAFAESTRFAALMESMRVGVWNWDLRKNSFSWSPREFELFGIDEEAEILAYTSWRDVIHPDDRMRVEAELGRAIVGEAKFHSVFRVLRPNAAPGPTLRWIEGVGHVERDQHGAALRMHGLNWDVTAKYEALSDLEAGRNCANCLSHQTKNTFQTYFEQSVDCLFHIVETTDGRLLYTAMNPAGRRHAGLPLEKILGRTPSDILGKEVGGAIETGMRQAIRTGDPFFYMPTFDMGNGDVVYDAVYIPIKNNDDAVTGVLGCARDITAGRRLEISLFQAQKMEALGQLTSGTAHDFNNILQNVSGALDIMEYLNTPDATVKAVKICRAAVKCGHALTSALLAFSRREEIATETTSLNRLIVNIHEMVRFTVGSHIDVRIDTDPALWNVKVSAQQVELAIVNLAINARDAMPEGGTLTIRTGNTTLPTPDGNLAPGDFACLAMTDTGEGMPADVLARADEAFYTTKPAGKGTGLGLSMVRSTVENTGGKLKITSMLGQGTTVLLYFPRVAT